ncbi:MAG TPA: hypothetical protein VLL57_09285, partial [Candidatus Binataceae bacterium]|nr:hypothetical protein [Candidatus Binataceae bacterium]
MSLVTTFSFEENCIRIVSGQRRGSIFKLELTESIATDQLDDYLSGCTANNFLVAVNLPDTIYETITIPPADNKLTGTLIKSEATRLHPELIPFSLGYQVVGDIPLEGKIVRKVACCLIPHQTLTALLEPFIRHNKTVRGLVAAPTALAALARTCQLGDTLLCAHDAGSVKNLFLSENGAVSFARVLSSNGPGWDAFDRQSVSMTMDYCFQSLRLKPSHILVLNPQEEAEQDAPPPRLTPLEPPAAIVAPRETFQEYLVGLALAAYPIPTTADLLPEPYLTERAHQRWLRGLTHFFTLASVIMAVVVGIRLLSISTLHRSITALQR